MFIQYLTYKTKRICSNLQLTRNNIPFCLDFFDGKKSFLFIAVGTKRRHFLSLLLAFNIKLSNAHVTKTMWHYPTKYMYTSKLWRFWNSGTRSLLYDCYVFGWWRVAHGCSRCPLSRIDGPARPVLILCS